MITHIVLFKLKDAGVDTRGEVVSLLQGLDGRIPTLRALSVGEDVSHSGRSYDVGIIARFDDLAGLESYRVDPVHVKVARRLNEICSSIVALDFEENRVDKM